MGISYPLFDQLEYAKKAQTEMPEFSWSIEACRITIAKLEKQNDELVQRIEEILNDR